MRIDNEFLKKYCHDIQPLKEGDLNDPLNGLNYDIMYDFGEGMEKAIYADNVILIPLEDIITLSEDDFVRKHQDPVALQAYRRYLDHFISLSGIDALLSIKHEMDEQRKKRDALNSLDLDELTGGF